MEEFEKYEGLIFDCDGTLGDTMPAHCAAYKYVFNHYNVPFKEEDFYKFGPHGGKVLLDNLVVKKGYDIDPNLITKMKASVVHNFIDEYMKPNIELIDLIKKSYGKCKIAVVSNGKKNSIYYIIEKLGIMSYVDIIITAEDCTKHKPDPEPFLLACDRLGIDPKKCLIFEDQDVGIQAAKAAGADFKLIRIE